MENCKVGFLGCGNMASAILNGMISSGIIALQNINIYDPDVKKTAHFADLGCSIHASQLDLVQNSSIIFLCMKPQSFPEVLSELQTLVTNKNLVVSIAAGISISFIRGRLLTDLPVVRVMPNIPLVVQKGASALCHTENVPPQQLQLVEQIFSACGTVYKVQEAQIDAVIAVSGSSPAYLFLFAQAIAAHGERLGLDKTAALALFAQTMEGSAKLLLSGEHSPQEWMDMVSSKGGTTLEALRVFREGAFSELVGQAMDACVLRAQELSRQAEE